MTVHDRETHVPRILIVEDEALLALDLAQSLRDFEYEVVGTAAKADQAIREAIRSKPDLILMDINLPGGTDGIEAYATIRKQLDVPVVYLTGYSERDVLERAKRTEPYGYLGKPVSLAELRSTIETALYKHSVDKRLRESQSRLKSMVDSLPMGAAYREGDSVYLNKAAEAMIGYSRDEIITIEQWFTTLYKDDAERIKAYYHRDREAKFPESRTVTLIRKDGTPRAVSFAGYVYEGGDVWLMVDETEKSHAKEELRRSEDLHRTTLANISDAIFITDDEGVFVYVGPNIHPTFGYSREEVERLENITKLMGPGIFDPSQLEREKEIDNVERTIVDKKGREHVLLINVKQVDIKGGTVLYTCRDITDRKKVEKDLLEREALIRSISDNLPSGMLYQVVRNSDGSRRFTYLSKSVRDFYGCSAEEAIKDAELIYGRVHPEDRFRVFSEEEKAHETLSDFRTEVRMINPSGDVRWSYFASSPRRLADGSTYWSGLEIDITDRKRSERALRESEERFRLVYESNMLGMSFCGMDGEILDANDAYLSMIRRSRDDLINNRINWKEITPPEHLPSDMKAVEELLDTGLCTPYEKEYLLHDGTRVPVIIGGATLSGASPPVIAFALDITERKKAEEALQESEKRFRELYENLRDGVAEVDERGRFIRCNSQYLQMLGYSFDELAELTYEDVTPARWHAMESQIVEEQIDVRGYSDLYEKEYIHKNGTIFPVEVRTYPAKDGDGNRVGYWAFVRDIRKPKRAEEELRIEKEFTENALNSQRDTFFLFEPSTGRAIRWNRAFNDVTGYTDEEIVAMPAPDSYYSAPDLKRASTFIQEVMEKGMGAIELELLCKDGHTVSYEYNVSVVKDEDGYTKYLISIGRDITDRKKAEEQIKGSLKEKEILLREIHHRVKNNLAVVSSLLRLQSRYAHDDTVRAMFQETEARIKSMALAHHQLYQTENLSEINAGKYLGGLLTNLESSMGRLGGNIHVGLEIEDVNLPIDTAVPLGFIVTELVSNAFKHAFPDGRRGELNLSLRSISDQELELVVRDDGVGMPGNLDLSNPKSCGLTLVDVFVTQINGGLEVRSLGGTEVRLRFSASSNGESNT